MTGNEVTALLAAALQASAPPPLSVANAAVVFDAGAGSAATVLVKDGQLRLLPRPVQRPDSVIRVDQATLRSMVAGEVSGVRAFLDRRLTVRGNLAMAMELQAAFRDPHGAGWPPEFPRFGVAGSRPMRTHYLEAGPPDAPVVVLLHGLGATNASLLPLVMDLATDYRVVAPDLPGFGASDAPRARYDAPFFASWLEQLLDELGVRTAVLGGNSLGGRIALETALLLPDRVRGLVGLASAMAFRAFRQLVPLVTLLRPELAAAPMRVPQRLAHRELRRLFAKPDRLPDSWYDAAVDEFCRVMRRGQNRVAFFSTARHVYLDAPFGERGLWTRLATLGMPSLFIWGARDWLVPPAFARHVLDALPSARCVVLTDCGHVPQYEQPAKVGRLVRELLAELAEPGRSDWAGQAGRAG